MTNKVFDGNYFTDSVFEEYYEDEMGLGMQAGDEYEEGEYNEDEDDEDDNEDDEDYFESEPFATPYTPSYEFDEEEYETESLVYHDGDLYEAKIRLTGKEKKNRDAMSQLMNSLNKEPEYVDAKNKFVKVYKKLAKAKITQLGLKVKLANIDKITVRDLDGGK